jgi:ferredoxin
VSSQVISSEKLFSLIKGLMDRYLVLGPKERRGQPGFFHFDWLDHPEELVLDYVTTTLPPKKAFFPPRETLFTFTLSGPPELQTVGDNRHFILVGVHPCDLAAIDALDAAYSFPPADDRWQNNRARALIVGVDCQPDEYCFCTSMGTCEARAPADLFLTRVNSGYLVESFTLAGDLLLRDTAKVLATDSDLEEAREWRREKTERIRARLEVAPPQFAAVLEEGGLTEVWRGVADRCYSCGSCNTTCPTCFCFNIDDELDFSLRQGERFRTWDSCQLLEFALVAGDHNYRAERWQRVKHRWNRKFLYLFNQFGRSFCTGCGRCSRACTADINIVDVSNELINFRRGEESRG